MQGPDREQNRKPNPENQDSQKHLPPEKQDTYQSNLTLFTLESGIFYALSQEGRVFFPATEGGSSKLKVQG